MWKVVVWGRFCCVFFQLVFPFVLFVLLVWVWELDGELKRRNVLNWNSSESSREQIIDNNYNEDRKVFQAGGWAKHENDAKDAIIYFYGK